MEILIKHKKKRESYKTHTAQRSFFTNAYLAGIPTIDITPISTHTTESYFIKYIEGTKEQQADRMGQYPFFRDKVG